jgi:transcriptional regulator
MPKAIIDRSERLLALILLQNMKGAPQQEKILQLSLAGFSNVEIADMLQTTAAVVSQSRYAARKTPRKSRRKSPS